MTIPPAETVVPLAPPKHPLTTHAWLWVECVALFGGLPLLFTFGVLPIQALMPCIMLGGLMAALVAPRLALDPSTSPLPAWRWLDLRATKQQLPLMLAVFALGAVATSALLGGFIWLRDLGWVNLPEQIQWFALPRERPILWLAILCLYPLLSVYAQELLYRGFFCRRYAAIFPTPIWMITANALAFGWGHIVFQNTVAVALTTLGGALFCATYLRRGSLGAAWFEHALYGCWIFTVGFGWWFYGGSVQGR